ncbi:hypothetical protein FHS43_003352 [Streptosporangium becharense]|uniref:Uncharacterized protein n=1 Tax=Streptosporangium becharense TaxID=1816182 RepID=A0A7W9IEE7_9ACTN|nr:hypothetical protein [Streptosporangium becharense]MBB2912072.1 hypothetical protein [Streptosporangium becharense]MBB5818619.1 hypothetical protein [Streptosporangium becharense]
MTNSWTSDSGADLATGYARHAGTLRGALRHALVARALREHLPAEPQRVLDVGGGDAHQAVPQPVLRTLIQPPRPITRFATRVHHITDDEPHGPAVSYCVDTAPGRTARPGPGVEPMAGQPVPPPAREENVGAI